ncbi:hypothetical protein BSKO_00016 [Bryopsis sp. KO-2023]|nr:hypothetical protein BSKO_00016 [Bryopsis sp. KO-2023]
MSFLRRLARFSPAKTGLAPVVYIESVLSNGRLPLSPLLHDSWPMGRTWLSDAPGEEHSPAGFKTVPYTVELANLVTLPGVVLKEPKEARGRSRTYLKLDLVCPVKGGKFFDRVGVFFSDSMIQRISSHVKVNDEVVVKGELHSFNGAITIDGSDVAFLEKGTGPVPQSVVETKIKEIAKEGSKTPSKPLSTCMELYNSGMDWIKVAEEVGVKPSTVLGYLGDCYSEGKNVDINRICNDAMLGSSDSSEFLHIDMFVKAIKEEGVTGDFMRREKMKKVVERVRQTAGSEKLNLQEEIGKKREIGALVFAQVRIVHAMMLRGLPLEGKSTEESAPF